MAPKTFQQLNAFVASRHGRRERGLAGRAEICETDVPGWTAQGPSQRWIFLFCAFSIDCPLLRCADGIPKKNQ